MKKRMLSLLLALVMVVGLVPMTVLAVTDSEPNDTLGQAQTFTPGNTIEGSISVEGDHDWYKFTLNESGRISLTMKAYMKYYTLQIYDINGTELWYDEQNEWNSNVGFRSDTYTVDLTAGTYYLRVTGKYYADSSSSGSTGSYTLTTSFSGANATETEDNNIIANADPVALDGTIRGQIAINDRNDYHQFTLPEPGCLMLKMTAYMQYYTMQIYDVNGTELWYDEQNEWNSNVGFRSDTYTVDLTAGTYYLRVTGTYYADSSGSGSTGNYTLITSFTGANANEVETNNSIAEADHTVLNVPIHGQIAINDRLDFFRIELNRAMTLDVEMLAFMKYYTLDIYDVDGNQIWYTRYNEGNSNTGYSYDYYPVSLNEGTYYIQVTGDYYVGSSTRSTGTYTLYLNTPNPFTDVEYAYYYDPVLWAVEQGITTGASDTTFNPGGKCLRAQVVTFLWRAAGCPEPKSTVNPFVDVAHGSFYEKPVLWAVENGITTGADATHFNPAGVCNRAQIVTFLYRAFGSPAVGTNDLPFTDVPAGSWCAAPVAWAVKNDITNGLSATSFGPETSCNRAQVVTFLYRAYN